MRNIIIFSLSLIVFPLFGQSLQNIHIQANQSKTFNLSEIAEQVQYVGLEVTPAIEFDDVHDVVWTDNYLMVQVSSIEFNQRTPLRTLLYDHSGKFILEYGNEDEAMRKILYDSVRDLLFVNYPKGVVKQLDFEKNVKRTWEFKSNPNLYHNESFYSQYSELKEDGMHYLLARYLTQTEDEEILYHFIENEKSADQPVAFNTRHASFSFRGQTPIVSFGLDNTLYQILDKKITPIIKFTIDPAPAHALDKYGYQFQGFIGNYLCIHYLRNMQQYLYFKNMRSGKVFQTMYSIKDSKVSDGIKDDILHTGACKITPLNRPDYFYFVKKREELQGNTELLKENANHTIFFVKLKP